MKFIIKLFVLTLIATLVSAGCGRKTTSSKVDVKALEQTFNNADPAFKDMINKAITAINASDYSGGFAELLKVNNNEKLTPEQRHAVGDALHELSHLLPPPKPGMVPMVPAAH